MQTIEPRRTVLQVDSRWVVGLDDPSARDTVVVGAKAANLAHAKSAGLPALDGFVLTTMGTEALVDPATSALVEAALSLAWSRLSAGGTVPLVVRSSSTVEDGASTSMAGVFTSVLDVSGKDEFDRAVRAVMRSGRAVPGIEMSSMAVLVQPMLRPRFGGVLFGADPVSHRRDRLVVAAVEGGPDDLVSGRVDGTHYTLNRRGRPVDGTDSQMLSRHDLHVLANLGRRTNSVFGGPQDVEWAITHDGRVVLLQARTITTLGADPRLATGAVYGPGPIAETLPNALSPLEEDLWLPPLREAIGEAVTIAGVAGRRARRGSDVVISIGGRLAVDLDLLGTAGRKGRVRRMFALGDKGRRLLAAWRVGRMRAALPSLSGALVAEIDDALLRIDSLGELDEAQLVGALRRAQDALRAAHGLEILAGLIAATDDQHTHTGAGAALAALAHGRATGATDAEIVQRTPAVLALVPPRIGEPQALPAFVADQLPPGRTDASAKVVDDGAVAREALRLRARWLHELTARVAWELGQRFARRGVLGRASCIRVLRLAEVEAIVHGASAPAGLVARMDAPDSAELPVAFRRHPDGTPIAVTIAATTANGAGGGRGSGPVHSGGGPPPAGSVLVVRTLDPNLAPLLPQLGGLVAESGSVLSHLAILAREFGVPTAVGVPDAMTRFRPGAVVEVDGATGDVTILLDPEAPSHDGPSVFAGGAR
jgi:phosphohistidine swiveling domain-containing protein